MSSGGGFDRLLIDLATTNPPPGRDEWARAMRAEFEEMKDGRTTWALGCLVTALRWQLNSDWKYVVALAIIAAYIQEIMLYLISTAGIPELLGPSGWGVLFRVEIMTSPAILAAIFAAGWPSYWVFFGLTAPAAIAINGYIQAAFLVHHVTNVNFFNSRPEIGIGALIGYCLLGALVGKTIGHYRSVPTPA